MRRVTAPGSKLLAYARLIRLPNLFTAVADPLAGWFAVGGGEPATQLAALLGVSGCFYTAGIVLNDCFDIELDRQERPNRPLPSGAISLPAARALGLALIVAGFGFAAIAGRFALAVAVFLAAMILLYNAWFKRYRLLGPLALASCRFANFLVGMRCVPGPLLWMPATLAGYVLVLGLLARAEAGNPSRQLIIKRLLLGIIAVDALLVAVTGDFFGAGLVLSLLVPAAVLARFLAMT